MGATLAALRTRTKAALKNRADVDTQIDQALDDQLREITSNIRFPEMEKTSGSISVVAAASTKTIASFLVANEELMAILNIVDVTSATNTFPLDQDDFREIDRLTLTTAVPRRYSRFGTDVIFDAKIPTGGRLYRMRYRIYHSALSVVGSSQLPSAWDEVIALGAALRVARDILGDYDLADEVEKQFTRSVRARGLTKEQETRDAEFGLQVIY